MTEPPPQPPPPPDELSTEPPASPRPAPRAGDRIGSYRLIRLIGEGAGGSVYEVVHEKLDRPAALKLLASAQAARPAARARFLAEALAVNRIAHPNIVEVTDVVETPEHAALVMELLEGRSLAGAMAEGPLPPERFLPILAQVCQGLAAAHSAGTVHRDLKPENVFLCARPGADELVKLLDFGVATTGPAITSGGASRSDVRPLSSPRPATFVGTPAYASPEQASGGAVGQATDIYAVGVILYELAAGHLPFEGWSAGQFVIQHLSAPVPRLPAAVRATPLGRSLDAVVQACMAKDPADRLQSAGELGAMFQALARGEELSVSAGLPRPRRRQGRWLALAGLGLLAVLAVIGAVAAVGLRRPASHAPAAPTAAEPAPAAPATVVVEFRSQPPGAEVRRVADGELLGVTPFRRVFPRGRVNDEWMVEVARDGWEPVRVPVSLAASRALSVTLAPRPAKRAPKRSGHSATGAGPVENDKTIDPFHRPKRHGLFWSR
jgi:serine/threonine-protein kinase